MRTVEHGVDVYGIENKQVLLRLTDKKKKHVNLLYLQDSHNLGHFACIKNLSRLMSSFVNY